MDLPIMISASVVQISLPGKYPISTEVCRIVEGAKAEVYTVEPLF
jgi:hypothetical protein